MANNGSIFLRYLFDVTSVYCSMISWRLS